MEAQEHEPGPRLVDIINQIPLMQYHADRFIKAYPEHAADVGTFLQELYRITSELQSAVYARQKTERGW
jgi:hypothetical protein